MKHLVLSTLITLLPLSITPLHAAEEQAEPTGPRFAVLVPERIDVDTYWYYYSTETQHIVQSAIEKALIKAGYDVVDLAMQQSLFKRGRDPLQVTDPDIAVRLGNKLLATHVIAGQAVATHAGITEAYGVPVNRYAADISVKLIRVSDQRVLDVETAESNGSGSGKQEAAREALKELGADIAEQLTAVATKRVPLPDDGADQ